MTQPNPSPNSFVQQNERNASRTRSPKGNSPSGRMFRLPCKDYLKGTCTNSFCESGILQNACSTRPRVVADFWEKCSNAHRQVDEQLSKKSKKNDDKSAVAMLKKNDWHENVWQPVVNRDKSHDRPRRPDVKRDTYHELKNVPVRCRSSNTRQLGCVFQDMTPPKSILRKSTDMPKTIQRVKFKKAIVPSWMKQSRPHRCCSLRTSLFPGAVVVETVEISQLPLLRKSTFPAGRGQGC